MHNIGKQFYALLLECIKYWGTHMQYNPENPVNSSKFLLLFQKLERMGVIFPKNLTFFKEEETEILMRSQLKTTDRGDGNENKLNLMEKTSRKT